MSGRLRGNLSFLLPSTRVAARFSCASALLLACFWSAGCGGDNNGSVGETAPAPAPFNTSLGEGNLVGTPAVTVYPVSSASGAMGLNTFYTQIICPPNADQSICSANEASFDTAQFGNYDLASDPIGNNSLGITNVDAIKIHYTAVNVDGTAVTVSGGIAMPELSASSVKGIILYMHGTTADRTNVPSHFTALNTSSYTDGMLLAAVWASQGYAVVMPDYIGLGDDTTHPHPYVVYPQQNAQSGLAMVKAARSLLAQKYSLSANLPLLITGYSEGGAYSLETGHLMQDNAGYASALNVTLKKVVPLSGFFDLSNTGLAYLFANTQTEGAAPYYVYNTLTMTASKPFLMAYLASSYAHYQSVAPTDIFPVTFDPPCSPNCDTLYQLYFTLGYSDLSVIAEITNYAAQAGYPGNSNSITPLLTSAYASALMNHDTGNQLYQLVAAADTYTFTPQFPVTLLSLQQDSVVTRANSDVAYQYFTGKGTPSLYQEVLVPNANFEIPGYLYGYDNIDHTSEVPFLSVAILNQFNGALSSN